MWEAYLFQVQTGQIGAKLNVKSASWSININDTESLKVVLKKSDLPAVDFNTWLYPWWAGIVLTYNGQAIVGGPIINRPTETHDEIQISCGGIRAILARRYVIAERNDWTNVNKAVIAYRGLSLGTIAKRVVEVAQEKDSGMLPIIYRVADQTAVNDANHQRTYESFNVPNLNVDDVLTKLSNVIDGPDIMFIPRLQNDSQLVFDMWNGTENQPFIPQMNVPVWDLTSNRGAVTEAKLSSSAATLSTRVYSTGAGTGKGTIVKVVNSNKLLLKQFPMLESVISPGDKTASLVEAKARAFLNANSDEIQEIDMIVRADAEFSLGEYWPGNACQVYLKGYILYKDGLHNARILGMSGDITSQNVKISLQTEGL